MSTHIQRPCKKPGCGGFAGAGVGYCAQHAVGAQSARVEQRAQFDARRGSAHARGYDGRWQEVSRHLRALFPLSLGYLVPTEFWTPQLAQRFHAERMAAQAAGQFISFFREGALRFIAAHPIYTWHPSAKPEPSAVTDHIVAHRGDPALFWAEWNLQPIGKRQHDTKTATEDGGFRGVGKSEK